MSQTSKHVGSKWWKWAKYFCSVTGWIYSHSHSIELAGMGQFALCQLAHDKAVTQAREEVTSLSRFVTRKLWSCVWCHDEVTSLSHGNDLARLSQHVHMVSWARQTPDKSCHVSVMLIGFSDTAHDTTGINQSNVNVYKLIQACEQVTSLSWGSHRLVSDVRRQSATSLRHCGQLCDKSETSPLWNQWQVGLKSCRVISL